MASHIGLKFFLGSAILLLACQGVFADSAANNGKVVAPAASTPNQTYLLDSGVINYIPSGKQYLGGNGGSAGCSGQCIGTTNLKGICPTGFIPYFTVTPFKSTAVQVGNTASDNGVNAICVSNVDVAGNGSAPLTPYVYEIGFGYTQAPNNYGAAGISGAAFNWYIYCVPGSYASANSLTLNQWPTWGSRGAGPCSDAHPEFCWAANSQACTGGSLPPTTVSLDLQPLVWDRGTIDFQSYWGTDWIVTNRICPPNYYPHISLSLYKGSAIGPQTQPYTISACLMGVAGSTNTLDPSVNPNFHYQMSPYVPGTSSGTSKQAYAAQLKVSCNGNACTLYQGSNHNQGLNWTLTCYPGNKWPDPNSTAQTNGAENDSTCALPAVTPQPFVLDTGYDPLNSATTAGTQYSQTTKVCPAGWMPSATIAPSFVGNPASGSSIQNFQACSVMTCRGNNSSGPLTYIFYNASIDIYTNQLFYGTIIENWTVYCNPPGTAPTSRGWFNGGPTWNPLCPASGTNAGLINSVCTTN